MPFKNNPLVWDNSEQVKEEAAIKDVFISDRFKLLTGW